MAIMAGFKVAVLMSYCVGTIFELGLRRHCSHGLQAEGSEAQGHRKRRGSAPGRAYFGLLSPESDQILSSIDSVVLPGPSGSVTS